MKTVNILGDTAKEQWLNAIGICDMAIEANINDAMMMAHMGEDVTEPLEAALRVLGDYTSEMRRLVEGVM